MANKSLIGQLATFLFVLIAICMLIVAIPIILFFLIIASLFPSSRSFVKNKTSFIHKNLGRKSSHFDTERPDIPSSEEIIDVTAQEIIDEDD